MLDFIFVSFFTRGKTSAITNYEFDDPFLPNCSRELVFTHEAQQPRQPLFACFTSRLCQAGV
jgi:hypothetical protein